MNLQYCTYHPNGSSPELISISVFILELCMRNRLFYIKDPVLCVSNESFHIFQ